MADSTFPKRERMASRRLTDRLFGGGQSRSLAVFPVRAVYLMEERHEGDAPVQVLVSVSKKHFHHAVDRNRVKRQLREAYRKNKHILHDAVPDGQQMLLAFIWLADSRMPTRDVEQRVVSILHRLAERV